MAILKPDGSPANPLSILDIVNHIKQRSDEESRKVMQMIVDRIINPPMHLPLMRDTGILDARGQMIKTEVK